MRISNCDFCCEFAGSADSAFAEIYNGNPKSRFLLRSDHFAVVPSIGQVVEGYLLVLPIKHFRAVGDMSGRLLEEFEAVCRRVGQVLKDQYGPYILFEHGTRSDAAGGCGIYHAHLHAAPLVKVADPIDALKLRFSYIELAHMDEMCELSAGLSSYLLYQDSDGRRYVFDTGPLPSQYMRKILATSLGEEDWDWRNAGREERLLATIERLAGKFETEGKVIR